ncbi:MAG: DUF4019 domain-containing protein [Proteobacteria bacterium]|nr:DUF4019 domain-containing protein [Pseudomonadota bacterium]
MAWLVIAFSLLISAPAAAGAMPATSMTMSPDDRAKQWMTLIDDQNYADAYRQMGAAGRGKLAIDPWTQKMRDAREPLGAVSSRALKDVKMTKTLPGMRDGQYATVRYDSAFAHKAAGVESVTLVLENGAWSVIGYFIA